MKNPEPLQISTGAQFEAHMETEQMIHPHGNRATPTLPIDQQLFSKNANKTLDEVKAVFSERSAQYGNTWKDCQWLAIIAAGRSIGITLTVDQARLLGAATLYDVKYQRLQGGYKDDHLHDGIAYAANFKAEMDSYLESQRTNGS